MLKPIVFDLDAARQERTARADTVNNVFKVMHGFYGNLFLSKFATGDVDDNGDDRGIKSARHIWAYGLREFDGGTIKTALGACQAAHPEFPPSLPQLVALCRAAAPRKLYKPDIPAIEMGQPLRSQYARQARAINEKHAECAVTLKTGFVDLPKSLDGLKQAIAQAVALAGGDESRELLRLDRMFSARVAA